MSKVPDREVAKLLHEAGYGEGDFFDPPSKHERKPKRKLPYPWPVAWFGKKSAAQY